MNFSQFSHFAWVRNHVLAASVFCFAGLGASANNIQVSNVTLTGQDVSAGVNNAANFTYIEFDLTWENSWRTSASPNNWDAAWVFIKFKTVGGSTWNHVYLAPSGHNTSPTTPTTSYSVQVGLVNEGSAHNATTNPAVGAFIYRSANGTGTFTAQDIRLKWFYRDNGVGDNDIIDVDVYAIEMVYVPDGSFSVGNNANTTNTTNAFYKFVSGGPNTSYEITSEGAIPAQGGAANNGYLTYPEHSGYNVTVNIPAGFPKGYKGFYCMKYEGSQQNWVDFINALTTVQQNNLDNNGGARNGISVTSGVASTTLPFVPKHRNKWSDLASYLDWAGLRPMTDFEYEKACRGTGAVVTDEFAWGNTTVIRHTGSFSGSTGGTSGEVSSVSGANCAFIDQFATAQIRSGSFATSTSSRTSAGASFYGIMDLSGNGFETAVHSRVDDAYGSAGSNYTGIHGNGLITSNGYADVSNWPGLSSGAVTNAGVGVRGGSYDWNAMGSTTQNHNRVADRQFRYSSTNWGGNTGSGHPDYTRAIRGVHTEPITASETK